MPLLLVIFLITQSPEDFDAPECFKEEMAGYRITTSALTA